MANSNMYTASADEIWGLFSDYVEGNPDGGVMALSLDPLPSAARTALEKSFAAFGYGEGALAYATLRPYKNAAAEGEAAELALLDPQAEFLLIEGLDPVCLVACDDRAVASLESVYRTTCKRDASVRLLGRPCVLFRDMSALLGSDQGKQRIWALLKTLPKIS